MTFDCVVLAGEIPKQLSSGVFCVQASLKRFLTEMTFYEQTILKIKREFYSKDHLIQQVIKAKQFIDSHFSDKIDLSTIAHEAFYSKYHFIRCFKSIYGQTPHQYLMAVRIEKAKQFLQLDSSLADVCDKIGFDSITSFVTLFKKLTGTTPAAYRARKKQFSRIETTNQYGDLQAN